LRASTGTLSTPVAFLSLISLFVFSMHHICTIIRALYLSSETVCKKWLD
jgi:hypothetical protein